MDRTKKQHKNYVANLEKESKDNFKELQLKNTSLQDKLHDEQAINATNAQRIAMLEKQCEDATASAVSSAFSKFSQQEFKDFAIRSIKNTMNY